MLRESALAQYLLGQLRLDGTRFAEATFTRTTPEMMAAQKAGTLGPRHPALKPEVIDTIIDTFLERIRPYTHGRTIIVLDGRRTGPPRRLEPLDLERLHALRRFREAGLTIVDAEALYGVHLAGSPLSVEVGPYDKHLNALALKMIFEATAKELQR